MLTEKKIAQLRKILEKRLDELLEEADGVISSVADLSEESPDFVDQASLESDRNFTVHIKEREGRLIQKIRKAIEKIEMGTYGK
jgi:DnaK suppressor protein